MKKTIILMLIVVPIALFIISLGASTTKPGTRKYAIFEKPPLITVEHDGHLWIVPNWNLSGSTVHHPECKCKQLSQD